MHIRTRGHGPDLMAEAEKWVDPFYPTAIQVENIGTSSKGPMNTSDDVDRWRFIFTEIDGDSTITVDYVDGGFTTPVRVARPWTETVIKELPRDMTLDEAIVFLREAGYTDPFSTIILRAPTLDPPIGVPAFIFKTGTHVVYINATSGEVVRVDQF